MIDTTYERNRYTDTNLQKHSENCSSLLWRYFRTDSKEQYD